MGRIYPSLGKTGVAGAAGAAGRPLAPVAAPMLSSKLVPPDVLGPSGYPESSLGWASRLMVYEPDYVFDERDALRLISGGEVRLVGCGAGADGYAVTTYHVNAGEPGWRRLLDLIDRVKGAQPLPLAERDDCGTGCPGCTWGGLTTWRPKKD